MTLIFHILELPVWNLNPKSSNSENFEIFFSTSAQIKPRPPFSYPFQMIIKLQLDIIKSGVLESEAIIKTSK